MYHTKGPKKDDDQQDGSEPTDGSDAPIRAAGVSITGATEQDHDEYNE